MGGIGIEWGNKHRQRGGADLLVSTTETEDVSSCIIKTELPLFSLLSLYIHNQEETFNIKKPRCDLGVVGQVVLLVWCLLGLSG